MTPKVCIDRVLLFSNFGISDAGKRAEALAWINMAKDLFLSYQGIRWDFQHTKTTLAVSVAGGSTYVLPSTISEVYYFWNVTDDKPMYRRTVEWLSEADPDEDLTGSPDVWIPLGWSSASAGWSIRIYKTPDASYTLGYVGFAVPADFTDQDTTDLTGLGFPRWTQPVLLHWGAELMLQREGMTEDAREQERHRKALLESLVLRNRGVSDAGTFRIPRKDTWQDLPVNLVVLEV